MTPLRIFIGWDPHETVAYHVLCHSILTRSSIPVSITPLVQSSLRAQGLYTRERGKTESTEFSLTRFLVPALCQYEGLAVFLDCDMLCQGDIAEVLDLIDPQDAVSVCQHEYTPKTTRKMQGQVQTLYPRKNWSSAMVFNTAKCRQLAPDYVNTATGLALHRLSWASQVGALPLEWNWLVGEYDKNPDAKLLHYTLGGPWFRDYQFCDHHEEWFKELDEAFPTLNLPKPVEV